MLRWCRSILANLLPCRQAEPSPDPPPDGTVPAATAGGGAPAPGTPAAESTEDERQALEQAAELEAANRRISELERDFDSRVNAAAEQRLHELMPELPDAIAGGARHDRGQDPRQAEVPEVREEETPEERLDRVEREQMRLQADRDADVILGDIESFRQEYPYINDGQVLTILARAGDRNVNLKALCRISHERELDRLERYHQSKLNDPEYMRGLVERASKTTASGPTPPPALTQRDQIGAPGAKAVPITRQNATEVFAERLKQRGFDRRDVGPPRT